MEARRPAGRPPLVAGLGRDGSGLAWVGGNWLGSVVGRNRMDGDVLEERTCLCTLWFITAPNAPGMEAHEIVRLYFICAVLESRECKEHF